LTKAKENINVPIIKGRSYWADSLRQLRMHKLAMYSLGIIVVYILVVMFIYLASWTKTDVSFLDWNQTVGKGYEKPNKQNVLGTDFLGRSVLRKTIYGARVSLTVAFWASIISIFIGVPLGAAAGYFRGFIDDIVVWIYTTLSSIPYILLILAFALVLRGKTLNLNWLGVGAISLSGISTVYLAIGLTSWVDICRLIRAEVMKHKQREYILAAQSYGCSDSRIIFRHLIPNVFHLIIISFSLRFVGFIQAEVILSFLGLGEKNIPSWGAMIDAARLDLPKGYWWEMTAATVAIFLISLALNIFGDALRDSLDPKLKVQ
jgi:ABC-type dipeptide/oligopeptide/nickel transport system permease subunit